MKYSLLLISVMLVVLVSCFPVLAKPKLEATPTEFDFGITVKDAIISTGIWLKSTGSDTVEITKINTGCECTTIPLESDKIAPGDSTRVFIQWNTNRTFGQVKRYPRFYYKNEEKELRVGIRANVLSVHDSTSMPVSSWPFKFLMGKHSSMSVDSIAFRFISNLNVDTRPSLTGSVPEQVEIVLPEVVLVGHDAWGYVKLKDEFENQEFESSVTIKFTHSEKFFLTIPIQRKFYESKHE